MKLRRTPGEYADVHPELGDEVFVSVPGHPLAASRARKVRQ